MKKIPAVCLLTAALLLGACRDSTPPPPKIAPAKTAAQIEKEEIQTVHELVRQKHADFKVIPANTRKIELGEQDLFELDSGDVIFYTNKSVDFALMGALFKGSGAAVSNITSQAPRIKAQAAQAALDQAAQAAADPFAGIAPRDIFDSLPFDKGLKYVYGKGERRLALFEDPDCTYCQAFRKDLLAMADKLNLTVYAFPMVLSDIHPNALMRAKALSCAKDPAAAWSSWMTEANGKSNLDDVWTQWSASIAPLSLDCPAAELTDAWQDTVQQLGFAGTPTLMFQNGMTAEGRLDATALLETLDRAQADALSPRIPADALPAPVPQP